jgi:arrestin-related trafficking adapter 3/6
VTWRLKAYVHRPGAFTTKLTAVRDVTVISCPGEDDLDEHESLIVERQWEEQLQYIVAISGKMFFVGGTIPMQITFLPLSNVKIHRISVTLEGVFIYFRPFDFSFYVGFRTRRLLFRHEAHWPNRSH